MEQWIMHNGGEVVHIFLAEAPRLPLAPAQEARVVAGRGIEGDRYFYGTGTFWKKDTPDRHVTLIEIEALEALERDYGVRIGPHQSRRNIVTRGVALNHLVGREFKVGEVTLRGIRLCEPCAHLESLTSKETRTGLVHRGGLRAAIVTEGTIRVGDEVHEV